MHAQIRTAPHYHTVAMLYAATVMCSSCRGSEQTVTIAPDEERQTSGVVLSAEPVADFGSARFASGQAGAVMLGDRILVGDVREHEVRMYAITGEVVRSINAATGSPIGYLRAVLRCPDQTAAIVDGKGGRVLYVGSDGAVTRTGQLPQSFTLANRIVACVEGGALLALQKPSVMTDTGLIRSPVALVRATPDRPTLDTLGTFAGDDEYYSTEVAAYTPVTFGRSTVAAAGGSSVFVGATDDGIITEITPDGSRTTNVRAGDAPRAASQGDVSARDNTQLARMLAMIPPAPKLRARIEEVRRIAPKMRMLPAFEQLAADEDGRVWLSSYAGPGQPSVDWHVYTSAGVQVARLALPAMFEITDIGRSYVLGIQTKPDGSEVVQLYKLATPRQ